jgi:antitoxin (DNA-binding transcriptional repressor) of toxin-antitoxin stability system
MFHMKTASVRDLRQDFPRILACLQSGQEIAITLRRQPIARLVPLHRKKQPKRPMPDIAARLKKVFGARIIPDKSMTTLMDHNKGIL